MIDLDLDGWNKGKEEYFYLFHHPFDSFWPKFGPPRNNGEAERQRPFLPVETTKLNYSLPYGLKRKRPSSEVEKNERFPRPKLLPNIFSFAQLDSFIGRQKIPKSHAIKSQVRPKSNGKSGVILTREDTYCYPDIAHLDQMTQDNGTCIVNGFEVGHVGVGRVVFLGQIDVARLNVDECVRFHPLSLELIGSEGFKFVENHRPQAYVLLCGVLPLIETGEIVQDVNSIYSMQFEQRLRRACEADNTTFINYEPKNGIWSFIIELGNSGRNREYSGRDAAFPSSPKERNETL